MKTSKKIWILAGVSLLGLTLFGGKKAIDLSNVVNSLKVSLRGIGSFPEFFGNMIRSSVNIAIQNPTERALDLQTGGAIILKKLRIYNKEGKLAATASPNITGINIPAFGEVVFKKIPIESSITGLLNTILIGSTDTRDYTIEAEIEALGKTFII